MLEADGDGVGDVAGVFTATEVAGGVLAFDAEDGVYGVFGHDVGHLLGRFSGGVERREDGAHAGAGDDIDGDVMFFKPLQYADFRHGERAAAAHGEADDGTIFGEIGGRHGRRERAEFEPGVAGSLLAGTGGLGGGFVVLPGFGGSGAGFGAGVWLGGYCLGEDLCAVLCGRALCGEA